MAPWLENLDFSKLLSDRPIFLTNAELALARLQEISKKAEVFYSVHVQPHPYWLRLYRSISNGFEVLTLQEKEFLEKIEARFRMKNADSELQIRWSDAACTRIRVKAPHGEPLKEKMYLEFESLVHLEQFYQKFPDAVTEELVLLCDRILFSEFDRALEIARAHSRKLVVCVGRMWLQDLGFYIAPVLSVKKNRREGSVVIVDGGLQHLGGPLYRVEEGMRPQTIGVIHDGKLLSEFDHKTKKVVGSVYGSLGVSRDYISPRVSLRDDLQRGDHLVFPYAGAFGLTTGALFMLEQNLPEEWVLESQGPREITQKKLRSYLECF